jgi:hypothetical protein
MPYRQSYPVPRRSSITYDSKLLNIGNVRFSASGGQISSFCVNMVGGCEGIPVSGQLKLIVAISGAIVLLLFACRVVCVSFVAKTRNAREVEMGKELSVSVWDARPHGPQEHSSMEL